MQRPARLTRFAEKKKEKQAKKKSWATLKSPLKMNNQQGIKTTLSCRFFLFPSVGLFQPAARASSVKFHDPRRRRRRCRLQTMGFLCAFVTRATEMVLSFALSHTYMPTDVYSYLSG